MFRYSIFIILYFTLAFLFPFRSCLASDQFLDEDITQYSLEDLMAIEVYSASKQPESLISFPSAIYVLTSEEIQRSNATRIPELLPIVPGVTVQQIDANTRDISSRAFDGSIFANKVLVLIDGRAIYSPLYGGIFWDVRDVVLEDIERIEVIRGPGGLIWGANAVNGVIDILTKSAKETQGTLLTAGAGTEERGFGTIRHGSHNGEWVYRIYGKYFNRDSGYHNDGSIDDEWSMSRAGFRANATYATEAERSGYAKFSREF